MATLEKRGDAWRAKVRRAGVSQARTFATRAEASLWAAQLEAGVAGGAAAGVGSKRTPAAPAPLADPPAPTDQTTLRQILELYAARADRELKGAHQARLRLLALSRMEVSAKPLAALRRADAAEMRDARLKAVSGPTCRRDIGEARAAVNWWLRDRDTGMVNPFQDLALPADSKPRKRRLAEGEEARILEWLDHGEHRLSAAGKARLRAALLLIFDCGFRRSEIGSARKSWLRNGVLNLPDSKTGEPRRVPLPPRALAAIELAHTIGDHYLDTTCLIGTGTQGLKSLWKRSKISRQFSFRLHDGRHEGTSRLVEAGLQQVEVMAVTGHQDPRSLRDYYVPDPQNLAKKLGWASE